MGAALAGRKDGIIDPFFKVGCLLGILPEEDQACPGSTKGLMTKAMIRFRWQSRTPIHVRSGSDDIAKFEGVIEFPSGN